MKRTFLAKRNALISSRGISRGVLLLLFPLILLFVRIFAPNFFWQIFAPAFRVSEALTAESRRFVNGFRDVAVLAEQNEKLTAENSALASENRTLLQKSDELSRLLGTSTQKDASGVLAGVIARPPESPYDTLVLAAGEKDGVTIGMEAFGGGVPIGFVSSVASNFSRVTLFSSPGTLTSGWIGREGTPLSIIGAGGGALQAHIARAANVVEGDAVFVPGPGMLSMGRVARVESDPLSPGVTLRIQSAVNLFSLSWIELRATGVTPSTAATSTLL